MKIKFTRLNPKATIPVKATAGAAGFDLVALTCDVRSGVRTFGTGIAVEIPKGYMGVLVPRSSISNTLQAMANSVGIIDSDYRGEIMAKFVINGRGALAAAEERQANCEHPFYHIGDRICQLLIVPVADVELEEVDFLDDTARGAGGFGSTGR